MVARPDRTCAHCGRRFAWRRKWAKDWRHVRYCSASCRARRGHRDDRRLEQALLDLVKRGQGRSSVSPQEAAQMVDPIAWQHLLEPARRAARRLAARNEIEILQDGRPVDPSAARGPIRVRRT